MDTNEVGAMREQFAQFLDYVNDKAAQAGLVSGLQQQVNDLRERVANLEQQNYNLQQELNNANSRAEQYQTEANVQANNFRVATEHTDALRNTIVESNAKVSDLNTQLTNERDAHRITIANLDDSRRAVSEWEQRSNDYKDRLAMSEASRNDWVQRSNDWEKRCSELQNKLDGVNRLLNPVISADVQVAS